ncbi:MAG: hypothetical protein GC172_01300 [Phycisphaera sp.]|nr:hypothetical protein [Phycisphaera sp.]
MKGPRMNHPRPWSRALGALSSAALLALSSGCASHETVGEAELVSLGPKRLAFERGFVEGSYASREAEHSFWFSDVPLSALLAHDAGTPLVDGVFLHAQLIWLPLPGRTPLDPTATNLVTRVLIVSNGESGLYGGAAFARVDGEPGDESVTLEIEGGTLTLLEKTDGFVDLLSPVGLEATLTASLRPEEASRWRRALSQFATNAFGRSMWVSAPRENLPALATR